MSPSQTSESSPLKNPCICAHSCVCYLLCPSGRRALLHSCCPPSHLAEAAIPVTAASTDLQKICFYHFISVSITPSLSHSHLFMLLIAGFTWASAAFSSRVSSCPLTPSFLPRHAFRPLSLAFLYDLLVPALGSVQSPQSSCIWFLFNMNPNGSRLDSAYIGSGCMFVQPR